MTTTLVTGPVTKPVSLAEVKRHLIIADANDDIYLEMLMNSAIETVENITNRKLITQTWKFFMDKFPSGDYFELPYGKLSSVTHVKYKDTDGDQTTWDSSEYIVDTDSEPGRVVLDYGETWPSTTLYPSNPIEVQFVCGYGAMADISVPAAIRQAILVLVANGYENRQSFYNGTAMTAVEVPDFVINLLGSYRLGWFS